MQIEKEMIKHNETVLLETLSALDPKLWRIKRALSETNVNPDAVVPFIEAVGHVYHSTREGRIVVVMRDGVIIQTKGETFRNIEIEAVN